MKIGRRAVDKTQQSAGDELCAVPNDEEFGALTQMQRNRLVVPEAVGRRAQSPHVTMKYVVECCHLIRTARDS